MATTAPEPEDFRVTKIEFIEDDENRFPPVPVATVMVGGMPYDVTLDAESMTVDTDAFSGSGLDYDDIGDINYAVDTYRNSEEIEPSLTQATVEGMVEDLSLKTGVEYEFRHFSGDQYELRSLDTEANAWVAEGRYNGLQEAHRGVQDLVSAAPEISVPAQQVVGNLPVDSHTIDLDQFAGPVVSHVQTYPGGIGKLPSAEAVLNTYKHDLTLVLDPQTLRVDVAKSHAPNFELDEKALARIHGEIEHMRIEDGLQPPLSEDKVAAISDGLEHLTGQLHDFRQVGDKWELRKRDEDNNWQHLKQYADIPEAYLDVIQRSEVAELKMANPAAGETLDAMLTQLDKNTAQEIKPVDPAALPEPVDLLQAGPSDLKSGMDNMRKAVAEAPIGQPHSANGSRLSQEVVEKTLQMMLAQLDRNEEQQKQAVKR